MTSSNVIRVASAQYPVDELVDFSEFKNKLTPWVKEAVANKAQLLVFPEYAGMELTRLYGLETARHLQKAIEALQQTIEAYDAVYASLARKYGVYILAGSIPVYDGIRGYINRASLFSPQGPIAVQEKNIMTRFEREAWGISSGAGLNVFDIGFAKIGIAICYDVEFPLLVHQLCQAGADIILAPSCTDALSGYNRVRSSCLARAIENQIYTVQSVLIGNVPWSAAIDVNIGAAGFYTPCDRGFPSHGVLKEGELNKPQWLYADLDLGLIKQTRETGEVFNFRDWDYQTNLVSLSDTKIISLV